MNTTLSITGMHCAACVDKLTRAFERVLGVRRARVTLEPPRAEIESDRPVDAEALRHAAKSAGNYGVDVRDAPRDASHGSESETQKIAPSRSRLAELYPLLLIVGYIAGTVALVGLAQAGWSIGGWSWHDAMTNFMAGFFLVFSFFKLLDLRGFANAYRSYDVLAKAIRAWAFAYPFVELVLGVAYLTRWQPALINSITLAIMLVGSVGVLRSLHSKHQIRCACLGTALNLPMTTVTLVEDLAMAAMAGAMLVRLSGS